MKPTFSTAVLVLTVLGGSAAHADVTLEMVNDGETVRMFLSADKMRMEGCSGLESGQVSLFDGSTMTLSFLRPQNRTYQKIDKDLVADLGAMMSDMKKMMEDQLSSLPPEQRKMIETQMKANMKGGLPGNMSKEMSGMMSDPRAAATQAEKTYEATGKSRKINGYECQGHKVMKNGRQVGEVWTATLKEVGLTRSDLAVFEKLEEFGTVMSDLDGSNGINLDALNPLSRNFIGLQILQIDTEDGGESIREVKSIEKGKVPADRYEVPSDYSEKSFMEGMPPNR